MTGHLVLLGVLRSHLDLQRAEEKYYGVRLMDKIIFYNQFGVGDTAGSSNKRDPFGIANSTNHNFHLIHSLASSNFFLYLAKLINSRTHTTRRDDVLPHD